MKGFRSVQFVSTTPLTFADELVPEKVRLVGYVALASELSRDTAHI